jgi:allophanate hydrolase subunit 2
MGSSAASSSTAAAVSNLFFGIQISERLTKTNHALWRAQVLTAIRGARLQGHIDGKTVAPDAEIDVKKGEVLTKEPNPTYEEWFA